MNSFRIYQPQQPTHEVELQESYGPEPCFGTKGNNSKFISIINNNIHNNHNNDHQHDNDNNSETQGQSHQFKRSHYNSNTTQQNKHLHKSHSDPSNQQKMNLQQFYYRQKLTLLKIELKLISIANIYERKAQNRKREAFIQLKQTVNPEELLQREKYHLTFKLTSQLDKIFEFVNKQKLKLISKSFHSIMVRCVLMENSQLYNSQNAYQQQVEKQKQRPKNSNNRKINEKRNSEVHRTKSQLDQSQLQSYNHNSNHNREGLCISNMSTVNSVKAKNNELKKAKRQMEEKMGNFFSQMEQMLSMHENFLKKK